jgi:DNA-binding LacI/PurR family transcriptional regulator
MTDVADLAGVSLKTVSRVINDEPSVGDQTRQKVLNAASALDFHRNSVAAALASNRTGNIGIITDATALYGPTTQFLGLERAVWNAGYSALVASLREHTTAEFTQAIARLIESGIDGLLLNGASSWPTTAAGGALPTDIPVVLVGDPPPTGRAATESNLYYAFHDQADGSTQAVRHLLGLGHRTVHHLAGPTDWVSARLREAAWRQTLTDAGAPVPAPVFGDWSAGSGYAAGRRLLAQPGVTAVFVANDQMAIGLLRAASEIGRRVPRDLSVIGFDDIPEAAYLPQPLTTVSQQFTRLAGVAVDQLVGAIAGTDTPRVTSIPTTLVLRASTARPTL